MQHPIDCWFLKILYDWQTLFAGTLAFIGALWTVLSIRAQIKQAERQAARVAEQAAQVAEREEFASKAMLPLSLRTISKYAHDCITLLSPLTEPPQAVFAPGIQAPNLPNTSINILQECARYADKRTAVQIATLIGKFQVKQARLNTLLSRRAGERLDENEGASSIIDAADVYARTAELFDYARDIQETRRRASPDQLRTALHNCQIWQDDHPAMAYIDKLQRNPQQ
jgi:hypothetical protein